MCESWVQRHGRSGLWPTETLVPIANIWLGDFTFWEAQCINAAAGVHSRKKGRPCIPTHVTAPINRLHAIRLLLNTEAILCRQPVFAPLSAATKTNNYRPNMFHLSFFYRL